MVRVKVLNGKGRVESIFLQGRNLPWLDLNRRWTVETLLDALKYFPGNEFAFWNREWKVKGIWRPIIQLKLQLFPPKPPLPDNNPVNKSGSTYVGSHFQGSGFKEFRAFLFV